MKKIIYTLCICCTLGLSSCIEETFPTSFAIESQVAASPTALAALVNSIPNMMVGRTYPGLNESEYFGYPAMCVALEEMTQDVINAGYVGFNTLSTYARMQNPTHQRQNYPWYTHYAYIKNTNDVIKLIDKDTQDKTEQAYLGVAYAFRAFYYLNLVRMFEYKYTELCRPESDAIYGLGVPIVTEETTEEQAKSNPRATVEANYELIFSDLAKAEKYLTGYTPDSKAFPSLACVYGLYARAYLERGTAGVSGAYAKAAEFARRAITESGCTPLTQDQWEDPVNGFNNATSQNSWMWGVCITSDNIDLIGSDFYGLMMAEQTWTVYGWRVGRSASRKFYEAIPYSDFRKYSWLDPEFYGVNDNPPSDLCHGHEYKLAMPAATLRGNITKSSGFTGFPWIYNPIKFRPAEGSYSDKTTGSAMDFPMMRVEEMYLIEAEATAYTDQSTAARLLNEFMAYRITDGSYDCAPKNTSVQALVDEIIFQKRVELWGEGLNYYDAKRLQLGMHRGYKGVNASQYYVTFDIDGIFPLWNCRIPESEKQGNPAIILNPTPLTAATLNVYWAKNNTTLTQYYGCDLSNPDGE
ncbi:MAG: RagB/SusD family nutrient uptake outer membrane protein [Prevotellaceae bacterium]|jgi:hypothetical protein|nr:RagB/SusD family nutrient uptake outer membrane protein [Prevotellaceae bacterium]